jgi:predicted amidophosphoribosyltransferase
VGRRLALEAATALAGRLPHGALVPVPLRADKRRERGFNQTEDFARALAARAPRPVEASWLARRRGGPALAGLPREARARAVRGAFAVTSSFPGSEGGPLILVDDVVTTGSTAAACAATLLEGGAPCVHVAAMGRAFASADRPSPNLAFLGRF